MSYNAYLFVPSAPILEDGDQIYTYQNTPNVYKQHTYYQDVCNKYTEYPKYPENYCPDCNENYTCSHHCNYDRRQGYENQCCCIII